MKRSNLKRKTPLRSVSEWKRKPAHKARKTAQKETRFRSAEYLVWLKMRPCCNCSQPAQDPHHVIGLKWGLSGMGMTAPDSYAIPLCRLCHDEMHRDPAMQWMQPIWLIETINDALECYLTGRVHDALIEARAFVLSKQEAGA